MELLKNETDFLKWKKDNISTGDNAEQPMEFPCWVRKEALYSVYNEDEKAVYLYRSDIERMLSEMG